MKKIEAKNINRKNSYKKKNNVIDQKFRINHKRFLKFKNFFILINVYIIIRCYLYFGIYNHASENALSYMKGSDKVTITDLKDAYFFDGPGTDKAFIFYPGGKVEEEAYAGIMHNLAENGIDCFLVKMPLRLAVFSKNKADKIINPYKNSYKEWYIGGHSLGGAMASIYTSNHSDIINGLILFAAYSINKIPDNVKVISFISSNDKVLNWSKYRKNIKNLPQNYIEVLIKDGNHSQFGDYGFQKGDGISNISVEEQHNIIVKEILKNFK